MTSRLVVRAHGLIILATAIVCVWAGMAFADVTKDQAAENAVKAVPGKVAEVTIEKKRGKNVYVVEVIADTDGSETDVLIEIQTGKVLGVKK